tara:strand:- start:2977 stop:3990 length:1014 start_codon:yes stop_codon:yes gene_type:complete
MKPHFFKIGEGHAIDETSGTIRQVSLMEIGNAEGHFDKEGRQMIVDETTLKQVYEFCVKNGNLKVKADHGSGVMATIGWADNFALTANKVTADFHIYETEPQRPRIIEMARKNPDHLGMSLEFNGDDETKGDHCLARCNSVFATALVSDPAANKSLFSAAIPPTPNENQNTNMDTKQFEELSKKFDDLKSTNDAQADLIHKFAKKFEDEEKDDKELESDEDKKDLEDDEEKDEDKKELDENPDADKDDAETKKIEMAAQRGAEAAIKAFSAKMGLTPLKAGPAKESDSKVKTYSEHVAEVADKQFSGNRVKAEGEILTNKAKHPVAYKAWEAQRQVQ